MSSRIGPYGVRVVKGYGRFVEQTIYMLIRSDDSGEIMIAYSADRTMMMGLAKRLNKRALAVSREIAKEAIQTINKSKRVYDEMARQAHEVNKE